MSLNPTITQSPVIVFLGAGASAPLGKPVSEQFVARLVSEITSENEASLLSVLVSARGPDLELIMGDLETFLNLHYVSSFVFDGGNPSAYIANTYDAESLRSLIRHSIIREYRSIDLTRAIEVYQPLFDTIFNHLDSASQCLPVFTTNYDCAIENFCAELYPDYECTDGMEPGIREVIWTPNEFEYLKIRDQVRQIVLFKVHGSVNWMRLMATGKVVQSLPMYDVADSDEYQNTVIYPTGNKVATSEPYLTAYHYFERCCERAKLMIAIGYSFRDYDALTSLLKAKQVNDDLVLILLSPQSYDVLESIRRLSDEALVWTRPMFGRFGDSGSEGEYLAEIDRYLVRQLKA